MIARTPTDRGWGRGLRALSSPLRLSKTPPQIRRGAPVFGEHTAQVLGSLGYSAEDVGALQAAGVAYDPALPKPAGGTDV
jgi:crotonobetainyl-CoA:carnitine CoA-transferase CaiB-like acyl-CoA transferase